MKEKTCATATHRALATSRLSQAVGRADDFALRLTDNSPSASSHRCTKSASYSGTDGNVESDSFRVGSVGRAVRGSVGRPRQATAYSDWNGPGLRHSCGFNTCGRISGSVAH